ncbi:protease HtpX [Bacillus luteolus]|uniref:Protease HtpX homolog n=1 Tax=Litchfieldia luteola TaxID=682179 RepID=A0ABR9QMV3_9BACI|nr:protease HtpX [Cytobacillus luteolus]MBE4909494.1 protease HtpX [Cytobacillus luteolus]MBP1940895.1 heat shock protein HtpX [Cytobacillus luteolus]
MGKRLFLLIATNILVMVTIGIILSVLPIGSYVTASGNLDLVTLLIFSAVIGFTGAFISLAMSRWMAKMMMGVRVLKETDSLSPMERELVERVHKLSRAAGITKMPEVGIYNSPEVNAFATGPSKNRSLVAVSTGLLQEMDYDAVEGVLAHEVAHIANGDMVTMTLLQGVVNTFVVFFARIVAWGVSRVVREDLAPIVHFIAVIVFQILFSILGSIVVLAYSRYREFHADNGGADLAGKDKMIHALRSLQQYTNRVNTEQSSIATLKINSKKGASMLFSSHPDLNERIRRLEAK